MIALAALVLVLAPAGPSGPHFGLDGVAQTSVWANATQWAEATESADSTEWAGFDVVEPVVRARLASDWQVAQEELCLDWGAVRGAWVPGPDARVELKGTGRGGYWIVAVEDDAGSAAIRLRAGTRVTTLVAARDLPRGRTLEPGDMTWDEREAWGRPESDGELVEAGWIVRRTVRAGEALAPPRVTPPDAVTTGGPVLVEWVRGAITLTLPGRALGTAPVGGSVRVRTETGERLQGRAVGPGRVRVSSSF